MMNEEGALSTRDQAGGMDVASRTDVGLRRKRNEDFLTVRGTPHGLLLVVCDGMGGHAGGELASRLAAEAFADCVAEESGTPRELLALAAEVANRAVMAYADEHPEFAGMGTTLVAALVSGGRATVANVGDSRAYLFHDGYLRRITTDHSLVAAMVERHEITEAEAERHPQRNVITRSLGGDRGSQADLFEVPIVDGDLLLLASDGLHGMIGDVEIARLCASEPNAARVCDALVQRALAAGGDDNVTVIAARSGPSAHPDPETDSGAAADGGRRRRLPRGLGLIIGVGLGAILFIATVIYLWRLVAISMEERDRNRIDSSGFYVPDSIEAVPPDTLRPADSVSTDSAAADTLAGDVLSGAPAKGGN